MRGTIARRTITKPLLLFVFITLVIYAAQKPTQSSIRLHKRGFDSTPVYHASQCGDSCPKHTTVVVVTAKPTPTVISGFEGKAMRVRGEVWMAALIIVASFFTFFM
ncbi:8040_t:CDS:2 [Paraglomus brasilianum]|uniref:8040_t:CDS:1 n=1 Tax=Paraglomus brasilianum TaxID=144538 RepID=A0A9N8W9R0_9GLOM|nr:8040_t:CDS:2 [Paraglomus brasilianum]